MRIDGWRYYNHAAVPTTAPHEEPNIGPIEDKSIWNLDGSPLLARWTTEFDCGHETNWWYVIKDTPFDIATLKAKRRYEINKGIKNFNVAPIDPTDYKEELYNIQVAAYSAYPVKYRPSVNKEAFFADLENWKRFFIVIGAFDRESTELSGYALLQRRSEKYLSFSVLKTNPLQEKNAVNAALVEGVLRHFNGFLTGGGYICDGARSINHETAFQDYLEKYFGFRKAYCKLHIAYNPKLKWIIKLIYPIRKILLKFDGIRLIHQINAILRMEEMVRENNG